MNRSVGLLLAFTLVSSGQPLLAALSPEQVTKLPSATHVIDFEKEVKPIFEASCIKCHGRGKNKGGFKLDSRDTALKGGDSGPALVPGHGADSYLLELVSGFNPDEVMPLKGSKLTREQVGILRAWIDQGMTWDDKISFGRIPPINLKTPEAKIPVGPEAFGSVNGIDLLLKPYYAQHNLTPGERVNDRVFIRRASLDIVGLLPTPKEVDAFVANQDADKRVRLVQRLLNDSSRYAQHWLTFWNDLLRNDYKGTGYIDEGRKQITDWLYTALATNLPFDQFVSQLINPTPKSEGFVKGIIWRGVVNASQTPQMQAAQNISQVFMGVNLKCASCHDSFINDWMLTDAYGLAGVYADGELEMVLCDKPTGKKAVIKFLYPELGNIDPSLPKADRMKRLAELMIERQNGRLSRTIVNRLWARFMGRGLVEPLDDMEQKAWNSDVLDWLAADLIANSYDLKKTLARILTSEAYQQKSVAATEVVAKDYVFRGPLVRRLTAEQFQDALSEITGVWHPVPASTQTDYTAGLPNNALAQTENPAHLNWIWNASGAASKAAAGKVYFRKAVELADEPTQASAVITCDNSFKLFINGKEAGSGGDHNKPSMIDLMPHLKKGHNLVAIQAVNDPGAPNDKEADQSNPAGLLCYFRLRQEIPQGDVPSMRVLDFGSSDNWLCSTNKADGWETDDFKPDSSWTQAVELGEPNIAPWELGQKFAQTLSAASLAGHVRSSLVAADPLMTALGRPNREQVLTMRASAATTLQALEMTNGKTLADELESGSKKILEKGSISSRELVSTVFQRALTRQPDAEELEMGAALVGSPAKKEGLEDLLWSVAMLPEFQLIY